MEKRNLKVTVDYTDNNFCGGIYDDIIGGAVFATGKTFELFKKEFEEGLKFHIQGNLERGESLPEDIAKGDYEIIYELAVPALLRDAERFTTLSAISKVSGINQKQLSHYVNGEKKARPDKREKIINGLHEIGRQALAFV